MAANEYQLDCSKDAIWDICPKHILNSTCLHITYCTVVKSFWNFAQHMAVSDVLWGNLKMMIYRIMHELP